LIIYGINFIIKNQKKSTYQIKPNQPTPVSKANSITTPTKMASINVSNFIYLTSIANYIDNFKLIQTKCMLNVLKEKRREQMFKSFIRNKSIEIKKMNPEYTSAYCIKLSMFEWRKIQQYY
jgi:hypothetical protein